MRQWPFKFRKEAYFRYWSRKAYAIFSSLGIYVTIGHLKNGVADCSLSKKKRENLLLPDAKDAFSDGMKEQPNTEPILSNNFGYGLQSLYLLVENHTFSIVPSVKLQT